MRRTARWARAMVTAAGALALAVVASAAPFIPDDDAQVLERLPDRSAPQYRDLKRLQAAVVAAPNDVAAATALANGYYRISRREGDPRFLGYAQALPHPHCARAPGCAAVPPVVRWGYACAPACQSPC